MGVEDTSKYSAIESCVYEGKQRRQRRGGRGKEGDRSGGGGGVLDIMQGRSRMTRGREGRREGGAHATYFVDQRVARYYSGQYLRIV